MKLPSGDAVLRIPETPPSFQQLAAQSMDSERFGEIYGLPINDQKYYHWDLMRRRKPPAGLSREEWWMLTKFHRISQYKQVPLTDSRNTNFKYSSTDIIQEALHRIDLGAGGHIQGPSSITNPETKNRYYISSLIQEAITSSQLEGAGTTRQIAKEMLRSGRPPRDRGERMILNNYAAMKRISDLKSEALSPATVFELHRIVTQDTLDKPDGAGRLRRADEPIDISDDFGTVYHVPPPAHELPERLQRMCEFANGSGGGPFIHPAVRAITLHFWLGYEHPFVDGNGRTARALFYWAMIKAGYWLCEFISISQIILQAPKKYERAFLYTETDDNDLTYFIHYHLDVVRRAVQELHAYIEQKAEQIRDLERRTRASDTLNHRQLALVSHALRHPGTNYTVKSHLMSHGVVYETARTDLQGLQVQGLLLARRRGRAFVYQAPPDLERRLTEIDRHR